jgi:hypothetical protein
VSYSKRVCDLITINKEKELIQALVSQINFVACRGDMRVIF